MMYEKGVVYNLKEVGEKFIAFAQKSNSNTQAWELIDNRLSSFYGATLRIPMKKYARTDVKYSYYIVGNSFLESSSGTTNFKDYLSNTYPQINFTEDYTCTSLDDVYNYINTNILSGSSGGNRKIIFNCVEDNFGNVESPSTVKAKVERILDKCKQYNVDVSLFITTSPSAYTTSTSEDNYKIFLRSSKVSKKPVVVCFGDSLTDPNTIGNFSWTDILQSSYPNMTVVNRGVGGNTTTQGLARFQTDVIDQLPDICVLMIGGNDLTGVLGPTNMTLTKNNYKQMVDDCLANNIKPVLGIYSLTRDQLSSLGSASMYTWSQLMGYFDDFNNYVKSLANTYDLEVVDFYSAVKLSNGEIDYSEMLPDKFHFDTSGATKVGNYVSTYLADFFNDIIDTTSKYKNMINYYDDFCTSLGVTDLSSSDISGLLDSSGTHYNQTANDYVISTISNSASLKPDVYAYFYVSLEHMDVTDDTYPSWLRTGYDAGPEYQAKNHDDEYGDWKTKIFYQSEKYDHSIRKNGETKHSKTKYGRQDYENVFKNTGELIAIGLHTLFDENLWMCEQGMITCKKEAQNQINDINLIPARVTATDEEGKSTGGKKKALPVFPGTGCPWFTLSDQNKIDFDVENNGITYWFTKNDYDATITIMVQNGGKSDTYQSMSFGMLKVPDEQSHIFPLYVAGGTQALSQDTYTFTPETDDPKKVPPPENTGPCNAYDLDIDNIALSNSNLLTPTKFNKANMSNFRVLSPEGEWRDIYSLGQEARTKATSSPCDEHASGYTVLLDDPVSLTNYHSGYFLSDECFNRVDVYAVNRPISNNEHSSRLENIILFLDGGLDHNEVGCQGMIPNCYGSWFKTLKTGEVTLGGKKYLSVPNGWENRLWNYPAYAGYSNDPSLYDNRSIRDRYDNMFKNGIMTHRLIIPLEDGA